MRMLPNRQVGCLLLMLVLAGCSGIPSQGPVVIGRPLTEQQPIAQVQFNPSGPQNNASPDEIVRGFLRAQVDSRSEHAIARSFLTPGRASTWRTDPLVRVYWGSEVEPPVRQPQAAATGSVLLTVQVPLVATVSSDGQYTAVNTSSTLSFGLVQSAGQWRIATVADGLVLSRSEFGATYRSIPLYFVDATRRVLVPDVRWFSFDSAIVTRVVSTLLAGPAPWLRTAVGTGAPPQAALTTTGVQMDDQRITVDLTRQVLAASGPDRQVLAAQIQATVTAATTVLAMPERSVVLTVEQSQYEVPSDVRPVNPDASPVPGTPVVLNSTNTVCWLTAPQLTPVPELPTVSTGEVSRPAIDEAGKIAAVLTGNRTTLVRLSAGESQRVRVQGRQLSAPSIDRFGWIWTADGAQVWAASDIEANRITAPGLAGYDIRALRMSRDGARAVVVATASGAPVVAVVGVVRDSIGKPLRFGEPRVLQIPVASVLDGAWATGQTLVVLATPPAASRVNQSKSGALGVAGDTATAQVWWVPLSGPPHLSIQAPGSQTVAASGGEYSLWTQASGVAQYRAGTSFYPLAGARWPAIPG